jgi:hypothetical protein
MLQTYLTQSTQIYRPSKSLCFLFVSRGFIDTNGLWNQHWIHDWATYQVVKQYSRHHSQPIKLETSLTSHFPTCIAYGDNLWSLQRLNMTIPDACNTCFEEHCWDGTVDNSQPGFLAPPLLCDPQMSFREWNASFYNASPTQSTWAGRILVSSCSILYYWRTQDISPPIWMNKCV